VRTPVSPVLCRLTVLCPGRRVDVVLPTDVPLADLVPLVLDLLGEPGPGARPDPWRFAAVTGGVLSPAVTLDELGIVDGEMLRLGPVAPPPPPPVFDDPVDALADLATAAPRRSTGLPGVVAVVATVTAAGLLATGGSGSPAWSNAGLGALGAAAALGSAARLTRAGHPARVRDDGRADARALVAAYCAVPLAAAAGWAAVPGSPDARLLAAVAAAGCVAALGQVAVRAVAPVLVATTVVAVLVASSVATYLRLDVAVPAVAAVGAAVAVAAGPLLPRVTLRLAGLPRPVVPADAAGLVAADAGPDLLPAAELAHRARAARGLLAGLSGGCAVAAMIAVPPAAAAGSWAGTALGAVVAAVLLLRARGFADPAPARVHVCTGAAAAVSLIALGAVAVGTTGRPLGALVLLGAAAATVLARPPVVASPVVRRAVDVAEGVLAGATIPLALAAADLFALVRSL
jgi:type VII secretion integral membrane protein EccD